MFPTPRSISPASPRSAILLQSNNAQTSARGNSASRFNPFPALHSLSPRNLFKRGNKISQSPIGNLNPQLDSRDSSQEVASASARDDPRTGDSALDPLTRRSPRPFRSLPSRRASSLTTQQPHDLNTPLPIRETPPTPNIPSSHLNQNTSLSLQVPLSEPYVSEPHSAPGPFCIPAFPSDGQVFLPGEAHTRNPLSLLSVENMNISAPKAARSARSNAISTQRNKLTDSRPLLVSTGFHTPLRSELETWSPRSSVIFDPEKRSNDLERISDKLTGRLSSRTPAVHAKRQSLPPFLPSAKLIDSSDDAHPTESQDTFSKSIRRRSLVSVDFQSASFQKKCPSFETSHPRFSFEPAISYRSTPTADLVRIPHSERLDSRSSQKLGNHASSVGVRTNSKLLHDTIKVRIDALTVETKALLELLSSLSNDFIIQEQLEDGELLDEIRIFLGDIYFKLFERYLNHYDDGAIPLGGPNGLLARVRRLFEDSQPPRDSSLRARLFSPSPKIDQRRLEGKRLYQRFACFATKGMFF